MCAMQYYHALIFPSYVLRYLEVVIEYVYNFLIRIYVQSADSAFVTYYELTIFAEFSLKAQLLLIKVYLTLSGLLRT